MIVKQPETWPDFFELTEIRCIDGDTIEARVCLKLDVCVRRRIRLRGFWAPEHNGGDPHGAEEATRLLAMACDNQTCFIASRGMDLDNHGRITATLWIGNKPADPRGILGQYFLTEAAHREQLKLARRAGGRSARSF